MYVHRLRAVVVSVLVFVSRLSLFPGCVTLFSKVPFVFCLTVTPVVASAPPHPVVTNHGSSVRETYRVG